MYLLFLSADTENLAWGMPTFQSSEMGGHGPGLAADGVFLCSSEKWAMETVLDDQHPWWMVDIQKTVKITAVKIYNHRPCDTCGKYPGVIELLYCISRKASWGGPIELFLVPASAPRLV